MDNPTQCDPQCSRAVVELSNDRAERRGAKSRHGHGGQIKEVGTSKRPTATVGHDESESTASSEFAGKFTMEAGWNGNESRVSVVLDSLRGLFASEVMGNGEVIAKRSQTVPRLG
jgi:hypothetical protein